MPKDFRRRTRQDPVIHMSPFRWARPRREPRPFMETSIQSGRRSSTCKSPKCLCYKMFIFLILWVPIYCMYMIGEHTLASSWEGYISQSLIMLHKHCTNSIFYEIASYIILFLVYMFCFSCFSLVSATIPQTELKCECGTRMTTSSRGWSSVWRGNLMISWARV